GRARPRKPGAHQRPDRVRRGGRGPRERLVRLVVVSDVHCNGVGFDAVVAAIEREAPDLVVHGGDLAFNGPRPAEVVDRVRDLGWQGIVGNTDAVLWGGVDSIPRWVPEPEREAFRPMIEMTKEMLGPERLAWLQELPTEWRHDGLLLVH